MGRSRAITAAVLLAAIVGGVAAVGPAWASPRATSARKIVGGSAAAAGQFPFMAFVAYVNGNGNLTFICSGTLVSSNVVLTAGHCTASEKTGAPIAASGFRVVTGAVNWTDSADRTVSKVSDVRVDPGFDPRGPRNDAGLLILSKPVSQPPVQMWQSGQITGGTAAQIAGWGETSARSGPTKKLRWAPSVVQSASYCGHFKATNFTFDPSSMLCAQDNPSDRTATCSGDSGGPLLVKESNGTVIEAGITSVGPANCGTRTPDYYTAVRPIYPWVNSQIQAFAP